jgi:hypothetical protein
LSWYFPEYNIDTNAMYISELIEKQIYRKNFRYDS